ncbi:hypothetical protein, partial [Brevundimonas naejangsanensis]|uniref:hypothetical protein n=1 Tax=Brevundimonas naejangsanensis TaxID=588932 RepID=UPI0026EFA3A3
MDNKVSHQRNPVGCASLNHIVENAAELPSARPSFDDCYTTLLHNSTDDQGLNRSDHSGKRSGGC